MYNKKQTEKNKNQNKEKSNGTAANAANASDMRTPPSSKSKQLENITLAAAVTPSNTESTSITSSPANNGTWFWFEQLLDLFFLLLCIWKISFENPPTWLSHNPPSPDLMICLCFQNTLLSTQMSQNKLSSLPQHKNHPSPKIPKSHNHFSYYTHIHKSITRQPLQQYTILLLHGHLE